MNLTQKDKTVDPKTILEFWHKVEYFTPFRLDPVKDHILGKGSSSNNKTTGKIIYYEGLFTKGNPSLPWINAKLLKAEDLDFRYTYNFYLYLNIFDLNQLTQLSDQLKELDGLEDAIHSIDLEERYESEEETCFAKIALDQNGVPNFDEISISTLPWALGKLKNNALHNVNQVQYEKDLDKLKAALLCLKSQLNDEDSILIPDALGSGILSASGLLCLSGILSAWANFQVDDKPIALIQIRRCKTPKEENNLPDLSTALPPAKNDGGNQNPEKLSLAITQAADSLKSKEEDQAIIEDLDILNSFYIDDLEKAINSFNRGTANAALIDYLCHQNNKKPIDLYRENGTKTIIEHTQPAYLNRGRWPKANHEIMSLMQQFAINTSFIARDKKQAIFSVNGPPGTGKTTLLQDIIAENITRRARILAGLTDSKSAFKNSTIISFKNGDGRTINTLIDALTGFEMLVVSSNNAAVENISKELPLRNKLGKDYQQYSYLQPVAAKVAAAKQQFFCKFS